MRTFNVCMYLVKAAELDIIRKTARKLLRGLPFTTAYTPHFAMCTDTLSEIMLVTGTEEIETKSVMRFSCSGLYSKQKLAVMRADMDGRCCGFESVGSWYQHEPEYFDRAAAKANQSVQKTLKEISLKPGNSFNVMVINNDILPLLELVATKEYNQLAIARPGDIIQFRYEVAIGFRNIMNWQLVHAYHFNCC